MGRNARAKCDLAFEGMLAYFEPGPAKSRPNEPGACFLV